MQGLIALGASTFSLYAQAALNDNQASLKPKTWFEKIKLMFLKCFGITDMISYEIISFRQGLTRFESKLKMAAQICAYEEIRSEQREVYLGEIKKIRHDLRSPLQAFKTIKMFIKDDAELRALQVSATRKLELIIFDLEKMDKPIELRSLVILEVLLAELISFKVSEFRDKKSALLTLHYNSENLSPVYVGERELASVFTELLENAYNALPESGGIVSIHVTQSADDCQIAIKDNGCGVPEKIQQRLFSKGATHNEDALGVGLYEAKKKIESWLGSISFEALSLGSQFKITLPMDHRKGLFVGLNRNGRYRIIDDDSLIPDTLKKSGFEILEVATNYTAGKKLLSRMENDNVTVLIDNRLGPDEFGTDLIASQPRRNGVFLCTNDYDDPAVIERARTLGISILPKPLCFAQ